MTTIEILERARPALRELQIDLKGRAVNTVMGSAIVKLLRRHFLALPPNKRGFPTTHFWRRAADATKFEATHDSVRISINQTGIRQRFLGGTIKPVRAKFLTIPAIAETYGHRAGDFSGLKIAQGLFAMYTGRNASLALVSKDWQMGQDPGDLTGVYFWLVEKVSQAPDPTVLPTNDEIGKTAVRAALRFFHRMHNTR